jgi:hypothetical protein
VRGIDGPAVVLLLALGASCDAPGASGGGSGTLVAALSGSGLRDEMRSARVLVFDTATQRCTGHRVDEPDLPPLATSGLLGADTLRATLRIPAGPRTIYVEVYRDADGVEAFGTGCLEVVLAAGEERVVTVEIVALSPGDADADADGDAPLDDLGARDADADGDGDGEAETPEGEPGEAEEADGPDAEAPDAPAEGGDDEVDSADEAPGDEATPDEEAAPDDGPAGEAEVGDEGGVPDAPPSITLVLSEVDYDQDDRFDSTEFVELYNWGSVPVPCAGLELRLLNGTAGGAPYLEQALACAEIPAASFHVLGSTALLASLACPSVEMLGDGGTQLLQNGDDSLHGDAVAIGVTTGGVFAVADQVAYEGLVAGWGEGHPARTDDATAESLQRRPPDRDTGDNEADFYILAPTPCAGPP